MTDFQAFQECLSTMNIEFYTEHSNTFDTIVISDDRIHNWKSGCELSIEFENEKFIVFKPMGEEK